ncbi:chromosome segregation protein SMC [candidate division KSB1 bacterium]|nr:chromosome segregation protein SMC [candidate division KSB1 bacterium]
MFFSELNIVGFKSFAKKTNIVFHDGITAIVGPNGCGKSNIMDSIRWVMGEQKSGMLRSDKMENVIFNGSASAKPVGMAEVSLRIQNFNNILPIEYTEVMVARRLFRSGESQYLINGNQCRLKEIMDLFMDTGIGSHAYSIIELPQVERILNGKPEERRKIFEEAAGITKYKLRRKATFRKLDATEKDLVRVEDIMSEVEKSVRSLRRQVTRAQRYQEISTELKDLEINLATHVYSTIIQELEPLETKLNFAVDDRESFTAELATKEAEFERSREKLLTLEKSLSAEQQHFNELSREIQKFEERILVNSERMRSLEESRVRYAKEKEALIERVAVLKKEYQRASEKLQVVESDLAQKRIEYEKVFEAHERLRSEFETKRTRAKQSEVEVVRITEELSRKQNEGTRLRATEENLSNRIKQLDDESSKDTERIRTLVDKISEFTGKEQELLADLERKRKKYTERSHEAEEARRSLSGLQKSEIEDNNRIEVLEHQAELVKRLLENYEDYPSGVRHLATLESDSFSAIGAVANLFHADQEHRTAIATALGEAATYLVVNEAADAFTGIGLLKQDKKGVVSFLPLERIKPVGLIRPDIEDLGVIGWANEIIQCENQYKPVMDILLGSFLVVQDIETANRIWNSTKSFPIHIVTLAGEVLGYWGIIRGGSKSRKQADFVGRHAQLKELEKEIEKIKAGVDLRRKTMGQRDQQAQSARTDAESLEKEIKNLENILNVHRIELGRLTFEEQTLKESAQRREEERQRIIGEVSQLGKNLESQSFDTDDLQKRRQVIVQEIEQLTQDLADLEKRLNESTLRVQEYQVSFAKGQSDFDALKRECEAINTQQQEAESMLESREIETVRAVDEIRELESVNQTYSEQKATQKIKVDEIQKRLDKLRDEQYEANVKADEQEKIIRQYRGKSHDLGEAVHKIELRVSELKLKKENLKARILEEFEYTLKREPVQADFEIDDYKDKIEKSRNRLKDIGPVNLLALKEYEQEKERLDFLQTQRDDLIKARQNLVETIDIINKTAREKFLETFEQVQKNFAEVFKTFFDGGRASLVIQEGSDPLEADIDIYATPGGKRLSSIQLLSGGEKSLTAISMLFAIYLVKPSPFCIFDEVDAPLDDRNVERFTRALKEYAKNTQFIVVTHNKLTMRAADQLYGITMEEEGISKVVSVKFDKAVEYLETK